MLAALHVTTTNPRARIVGMVQGGYNCFLPTPFASIL
jgi:hypothetical protein